MFPLVDFKTFSPTLLLGVRMGGLMTFAPFLGSANIPWKIKSGLTFALTALLAPAYLARMPQGVQVNWIAAIPGELMVGLGLGLMMELVFEGARLAGQALGFQFGYTLVNVIDPQTQVDTPLLTFFHYTFMLLIFLQADMHHLLFRLMVHSFDVVHPAAAVVSAGVVTGLFKAAGGIFLMGLQLAAPALTVTLMTDMMLSLMAKASPQLPVLMVGLPVKMMAGYAAIWTSVTLWPVLAQRWFYAAAHQGERLLNIMH